MIESTNQEGKLLVGNPVTSAAIMEIQKGETNLLTTLKQRGLFSVDSLVNSFRKRISHLSSFDQQEYTTLLNNHMNQVIYPLFSEVIKMEDALPDILRQEKRLQAAQAQKMTRVSRIINRLEKLRHSLQSADGPKNWAEAMKRKREQELTEEKELTQQLRELRAKQDELRTASDQLQRNKDRIDSEHMAIKIKIMMLMNDFMQQLPSSEEREMPMYSTKKKSRTTRSDDQRIRTMLGRDYNPHPNPNRLKNDVPDERWLKKMKKDRPSHPSHQSVSEEANIVQQSAGIENVLRGEVPVNIEVVQQDVPAEHISTNVEVVHQEIPFVIPRIVDLYLEEMHIMEHSISVDDIMNKKQETETISENTAVVAEDTSIAAEHLAESQRLKELSSQAFNLQVIAGLPVTQE